MMSLLIIEANYYFIVWSVPFLSLLRDISMSFTKKKKKGRYSSATKFVSFVVFVSSSSDEKLRPLVRQMVNMFVRLMNDFATSKRSRKIVLVSTFSRFLFFSSSSFSFFSFFLFLAYFVEVQSRRIDTIESFLGKAPLANQRIQAYRENSVATNLNFLPNQLFTQAKALRRERWNS